MGENSDIFNSKVGFQEQEALFADEQPFDLLCKKKKTPLKNPVYFHNHGELVFEKNSQTFKEHVQKPVEEHFISTGECLISEQLEQDQSLCKGNRSNLQSFCSTKKHTKLSELIEKRVLDASHQEIIAFPSSKQSQYVFTSFAEQGSTNLFYLIQNLKRERNFNQDYLIKFLIQQQENTLINNDSNYQQLISKLTQQKKPFLNICPISGNSIRIAVRMKGCDHEECFDLESILNFYNTIKFQGPILCPYPKCDNKFDFLTQTDQFYLDFEYQKWIMSNLQYMPMWSPILESSSFSDVYFLMHDTLPQYSNSIYWFTLTKNGLEIQQEYDNQQKKYSSGTFNQVKFQGNYQRLPIPVRCINCTDYSRFCDLSEQMSNASQCLLCGHQLFSEYDLVFDVILMEQIIKFCQLDIKEFTILSKSPLQFFPNLDLIAQKLPSQNLQNEFIIKTIAFNTGQTIQGLPIKWKNCQHPQFYDMIEELPRFCNLCKRHYLVEDILYFPQVRKCIKKGFTYPQVTFRNGQYINSQHDSSVLDDSIKNKTPSFIANNKDAFVNKSTALPNSNNQFLSDQTKGRGMQPKIDSNEYEKSQLVISPQASPRQVAINPFVPQYQIDLYQKFIPFKATNILGVQVNQREVSRPAPLQPPPQIQHNQQNSQRPQTFSLTVREAGGKKATFKMFQ